MTNTFFITGTDTDIGKTYVSTQLIRYLNKKNYTTAAFKPISAGCMSTDDGLRNEDALALQAAATTDHTYEQVNPFAFEPPIAPCVIPDNQLSTSALMQATTHFYESSTDYLIIEGVGGWLQPFNTHETLADYVKQLGIPVIIVSGIRLGCINHTLLTYQQIAAQDVPIAGWVANCIDPNMLAREENIAFLSKSLPIPLLATIGYQQEDCVFNI